MTHGNAVGHRDRAELARGGANRGHALLHDLGLAHQGDVAGRGFVPAGRHSHERLMDLFRRQAHRVIESAMRRPVGPFGGVPTGKSRLQTTFGVHRFLVAQPGWIVAGSTSRREKGSRRGGIDVVEWYGRIAASSGAIRSYA